LALRRHPAAAAEPSRRPIFQIALYAAAAALLAAGWHATPEATADFIAAQLPLAPASHAATPYPATPLLLTRPARPAPSPAADPIEERPPAASVAARTPSPPADDGGVVEEAFAPEPPAPVVKVVEVEKGDTLIEILLTSGVERADAIEAIDALGAVFRPKDLQPGHEITLSFDKLGLHPSADAGLQLAGLSLQPSVERDVLVNRDDSGRFVAAAIERPLELQLALAGGRIDSSLFEAGKDAAVPIETMTQIIKAFSYDIDFEREIQPGDRFEIVYERYEDERGRLARTGNLLYAALIQNGGVKEIYRFEPRDGAADYYNSRGESVRKDLLRTPLDVVRITSKFGMRKHPILGYSKMHKGIDFAASTGTPIFAAGDGVIAKIGKLRGYGNYIQIKHNSQYATAYAHMSRFAKRLKKGSKVQQGDVIGYVGSTGMATGPHLHYEILANGKQINPMTVKLAGRRLEGKDLGRFEALKTEMKALRRTLADQILVARNQRLLNPAP
jgi:murein DD-endopeptidase MepM/ murein hydrolase activator NlpD